MRHPLNFDVNLIAQVPKRTIVSDSGFPLALGLYIGGAVLKNFTGNEWVIAFLSVLLSLVIASSIDFLLPRLVKNYRTRTLDSRKFFALVSLAIIFGIFTLLEVLRFTFIPGVERFNIVRVCLIVVVASVWQYFILRPKQTI
jgi:hypothetical protein